MRQDITAFIPGVSERWKPTGPRTRLRCLQTHIPDLTPPEVDARGHVRIAGYHVQDTMNAPQFVVAAGGLVIFPKAGTLHNLMDPPGGPNDELEIDIRHMIDVVTRAQPDFDTSDLVGRSMAQDPRTQGAMRVWGDLWTGDLLAAPLYLNHSYFEYDSVAEAQRRLDNAGIMATPAPLMAGLAIALTDPTLFMDDYTITFGGTHIGDDATKPYIPGIERRGVRLIERDRGRRNVTHAFLLG